MSARGANSPFTSSPSEALKASIPPEQREALDALLMARLDGLGDIVIAFKAGKLAYAERLSREYADELHVLIRLREMGDQAELQGARDSWRPVMERMRAIAEGDTSGLAPEMAALRKSTERNRLIAEACTAVLHEIATTTEEDDAAVTGMAMSEEEIWPRGR